MSDAVFTDGLYESEQPFDWLSFWLKAAVLGAALAIAAMIAVLALVINLPHSSAVFGWPLGRGFDFLTGAVWIGLLQLPDRWIFPDWEVELDPDDESYETLCLVALGVSYVVAAGFGILAGLGLLALVSLLLWTSWLLRPRSLRI